MSHNSHLDERIPVAFVEAVVRFPLYEGDTRESSWNWFEYREPGITKTGELGTCNRPVTVLKTEVKDA